VDAPDPITAIRDAIRHWSSLPELADFAVRRHGYGNTDGGFGLTYPGDLDEYERVVEGLHIPDGFVRVYGYWGPPAGYELEVSEALYLTTLEQALIEAGFQDEAKKVRTLIPGADAELKLSSDA
jgi:hypothetical protein